MKKHILLKPVVFVLFTCFGFTAFAQPNWEVNPFDFVYSMTISGKITTDGYFSKDENDMVAAFIDGECCGVANVTYKSSFDDYFVFLMIYSNETSGTVTFKIYDASEDNTFDAKETINFTVNDIVGTANEPFIFSVSSLQSDAKLLNFSIPLQEGPTTITGNEVFLQQNWSGKLDSIVPTFELSEGAKAWVNGVEQVSGVTVNDFTTPLQYTVQAADLSSSSIYTVTITTANDIPTDITLSDNQKEENNNITFIGYFTVETENPEEQHVLSLVNASDTENEMFRISGTGLRTKEPLNFEEKHTYRILVRADDLKGGVIDKYFTIEVLDMNDAPSNVILTNTTTPVSAPVGTTIGELVAFDEDPGDSHTFTLADGDGTNDADNNSFEIVGNLLKNTVTLPFLENSEYHIVVQATDLAGDTINVPITIGTEDQGAPPHNLSLSNTLVVGIDAPPVYVGALTAEDIDQEEGHVFSLPENEDFGPDNAFFVISNNALYLANPQPAEEKNTYEILLAVSDSLANQITRSFIITVREKLGDDGFFINNNKLPENQPFNTIVGFFDSEKYQSDSYNFSLPLEVDLNTYCNQEFNLQGRTLLTNHVFDFEKERNLLIKVQISDGLTTVTQDMALEVIDQNDPPTAISVSTLILSESAVVNTQVATLTAEDQDFGDSHEFSLIIGNGINDKGNNMFKIEGNHLVLAKPLNFEQEEFLTILLRATDKAGATFEQGIRLQIADANDAPVFTNTPVDYVLQDQVYVHSVKVDDSEGDAVSITFEGLPSWLTFNATSNILSGVPANNQVGVYNFSIKASDGHKESVQQVVLSVINVNDAPVLSYVPPKQEFITGRDNQLQLPGDCITDPDVNDVLTYSLLGESNTALPEWLSFDASTLTISGNPPGESKGMHRLKLTATDQGFLKEWLIFELNVKFPTAIGDVSNSNEFKVYPNPVSDVLYVDIPTGKKIAEITISNIAGQIVRNIQLNPGSNNEIQMNGLSPGVYIIKMQQGEKGLIKKIIKE